VACPGATVHRTASVGRASAGDPAMDCSDATAHPVDSGDRVDPVAGCPGATAHRTASVDPVSAGDPVTVCSGATAHPADLGVLERIPRRRVCWALTEPRAASGGPVIVDVLAPELRLRVLGASVRVAVGGRVRTHLGKGSLGETVRRTALVAPVIVDARVTVLPTALDVPVTVLPAVLGGRATILRRKGFWALMARQVASVALGRERRRRGRGASGLVAVGGRGRIHQARGCWAETVHRTVLVVQVSVGGRVSVGDRARILRRKGFWALMARQVASVALGRERRRRGREASGRAAEGGRVRIHLGKDFLGGTVHRTASAGPVGVDARATVHRRALGGLVSGDGLGRTPPARGCGGGRAGRRLRGCVSVRRGRRTTTRRPAAVRAKESSRRAGALAAALRCRAVGM
jgi:hypothetical protein